MRKRFGRNDIILISVIVIISVALLLIWKLVYLKGQMHMLAHLVALLYCHNQVIG